MTTTAEHLRNTLDGRWRDVKNRMREELSNEVFRPHYTPNTVIARTKVMEQMKIMAAHGAAEDGFKKEHGGNGDVGAAVTRHEQSRRDRADAPQTAMAADAVEIDSTSLSLDEVIGLIAGLARERAGLTGRGQQAGTARTG